mgnify:FL=1
MSKKISRSVVDDLMDVMNTSQGRNVLREILASTGVDISSYTGQTTQTVFHEGRRSIGLNLIELMVDASPDLYLILMKEKLND